jgi:hypothetical protein
VPGLAVERQGHLGEVDELDIEGNLVGGPTF